MAVAEFERAIVRERLNAGLRAARARGVRLGRPTTNGKHGEEVRRRREGKGVRAIARELGLPVAPAHTLARYAIVRAP
jgi:DNA invertase Pin-like site-specific DNA recombinase